MFFDIIPGPVRNFMDSIFNPPLSFLSMGVEYLGHVSMIAGRGINLNHYFGFFAYLPSSMQSVVNSLLAAIMLLGVLQLIKAIARMYYNVKDGVQWW
ncbi:hypothetical protein [Paenibacillus sp. YN15]|uniref:hypothetical protein n=1 Tax=Paenibacillus sp. YN15 TaxID=1742774 RepID=UPI000DCE550D|nr:hypothetical protein [Paenibacillus sp. YN15]RAU91543.1 hypothetical protein DQG13_29285 [Paenibacillus sp. YN15]